MQAARGTAITTQPAAQPDGEPADQPAAASDAASVTTAARSAYLRATVLLLVVALSCWALDQLTKAMAVAWLDPGDPVRLLGGLLTLRLVRNPGAAFSLGENYTIVFTILSAGVLVFVLAVLVRRVAHTGWAVALGLLTAGILGNLTDRVFRPPSTFHGHVVDFLQLPYWAIFNVADMCVVSAAVLIMILSMVKNITLSGQPAATPTKPDQPKADQPKPDQADKPTTSATAAESTGQDGT